jgi:predicted molibdopterin-dependent oxidoreductase YjgC
MNRIVEHPILGTMEEQKVVNIVVDGNPVEAFDGEMILGALLAKGIRVNRITRKEHKPRGLFCGIGRCTDCAMEVNGVPNVRTCVTEVVDGMIINTQIGCGEWSEQND